MRIFTLTFILFISSCSSIEDIAGNESGKISTGLVLTTKALFICASNLSNELNHKLVINYGFKKCQSGKHISTIPINSELEITKVIKHNHTSLFSHDRWFALGKFKNKKFYYKLQWVQKTDGTFFKQNNNVPWQ
jgi:hypothetical protein